MDAEIRQRSGGCGDHLYRFAITRDMHAEARTAPREFNDLKDAFALDQPADKQDRLQTPLWVRGF